MTKIKITLRFRIFISMIILILVSFFLTGAFSFFHFKAENQQYHEERLRRKEATITESIVHYLHSEPRPVESDSIVAMFSDKICELSQIHNMDINLYSLHGRLLISSNPDLFDRNILQQNLPRMLMSDLAASRDQLLTRVSSGDSINFLSTYDYILNSNNRPVAIVNLPYFDRGEFHRQDINEFLVRLMWIYLLLFLISIMIAYFLSNYITGSLIAIGEKMKSTKINEANPPLKWKYDDEIGTLVSEYNRMLKELEISAVRLAKTERESAWKEMAKQVAHEIKNPLTPMRLNVQFLQRGLKTEEPEKLKEFSESMINQIDTLSSIAEAFSRFASMPEMKKERFPARDVISRTAALYHEKGLHFEVEDQDAEIEADKDQLVRVMNNLINNALQAIPEVRTPSVKVVLRKVNDHLQIEVKDNGTGIPQEMEEKIFEPRFTTKTKGMGLGLAMVKNIVDASNGYIRFTSIPGEGTTFYISLPLADKA